MNRLLTLLRRMFLIASTLPKLGVPSLVRVGAYRLRLRTGLLRRALPAGIAYPGPFFRPDSGNHAHDELNAAQIFKHAAFSYHPISLPPSGGWHANCLTGAAIKDPDAHWTQIKDFGSGVGDIKTVWEPSRFDWLPVIALRAAADAAKGAQIMAQLEWLVADWVADNPRNTGPNWKCGQETSLRALNLILGLHIAGGLAAPTRASLRFVDEHLDRVAKTISYAIGQDNNHAISEAAALYAGGRLLQTHGEPDEAARGGAHAAAGRRLLERSVARLFLSDGTFAQYSVVYHRMALSLLCLAELFRCQFNDPAFSDAFMARASSACDWLVGLIDPVTGDAPNFGANDGTFLFNLDEAPYRDFRPAADLAAALFQKKRFFGASKMLEVFGVSAPQPDRQADELRVCAEGGLISARRGGTLALLRIPRFIFRPGHADGLHLDVWHGGMNVLRDSGSYSYADAGRNEFHSGTAAHSTVTFDNRDQMPRIGRFLFGKWLFARVPLAQADVAAGEDVFWGEYTDWRGASHRREVRFKENHLTVCDTVSGFKHQAVLNWRLCPGQWRLEGNRLACGQMKIEFESSQPFEARLGQSSESRFYLHETALPVLQIILSGPGSVTTKFYLKQSQSQ